MRRQAGAIVVGGGIGEAAIGLARASAIASMEVGST